MAPRSDDLYSKRFSYTVPDNAAHYLAPNSSKTHVPSLSGNIGRPSLLRIPISASWKIRGSSGQNRAHKAAEDVRVSEANGIGHIENEGENYDRDKSDADSVNLTRTFCHVEQVQLTIH